MELFEKLLEQNKFENQLKTIFGTNKTVRFELHTPWRSNPIIYFNDNLDKPYTRLYIQIKDGKMIYRPIVPNDKKNHDYFKKLNPPENKYPTISLHIGV